MDKITFLGVIGSFCILLAFTMNQIHRWKDDDMVYDGVNFLGAVLLLIYSLLLKSYPFVALNLVWAGISLRDLVSDVKPRRKHPFHKRR